MYSIKSYAVECMVPWVIVNGRVALAQDERDNWWTVATVETLSEAISILESSESFSSDEITWNPYNYRIVPQA